VQLFAHVRDHLHRYRGLFQHLVDVLHRSANALAQGSHLHAQLVHVQRGGRIA